jgi:two-component system, OmpR family, sensor histidine kinase ChvG
MALDTDPRPRSDVALAIIGALATASAAARRATTSAQVGGRAARRVVAGYAGHLWSPSVAAVWQSFVAWCRRQPLWRFSTRTLWRRILVSNLLGLVTLISGITILSQHHAWLIDAKVESLATQARMIAVAIASNARSETDRIQFDPDRALDPINPGNTYRDGAFAAMELSIAPERVAPILRRLIKPSDVRVRIYQTDGKLITDSSKLQPRATPAVPNVATAAGGEEEGVKVRNPWTRTMAWFLRSHLPVYKEIDSANGTNYPEVVKALEGVATRMILLNDRYQQIVSVAAPIQQINAVKGVVLLSTIPGDIDSLLQRERRAIFWIFMIALLASVIASWFLGRTIAGPVHELAQAAQHVSYNINARRELPDMQGRKDEVGQLSVAFRDMTSALYRRIEASDRFAQDVAHELKNPLTAARSTADSLTYAKTPEKRDELVRQINGELKRLNRLITDIANASRLDAELALQENEPFDLRPLVKGVVDVFSDIHRDRDLTIDVDVGFTPANSDAFIVRGNDGRLGQVITNLIDNAISFSPEGGAVAVKLTRVGPLIELVVDDDGPGIPSDKLDDVFKRFYSDRPQSDQIKGKNSGLGLSISREIVEAHGGTIRASNRQAPAGYTPPVAEQADLRVNGVCQALPAVDLSSNCQLSPLQDVKSPRRY